MGDATLKGPKTVYYVLLTAHAACHPTAWHVAPPGITLEAAIVLDVSSYCADSYEARTRP